MVSKANPLSPKNSSPMESQGLNEFIRSVTGDRPVESGTFSMSLEKAEEKLGRFQLPDPYLYVSHLIACAVLGGAAKFNLERSVNSVKVEFDGELLEREELESIFAHLFAGSKSKRLEELAVALRGAEQTGPATMRLTSGNLIWVNKGGSTTLEIDENGGKNRTELTLEYPSLVDRVRGFFSDPKRPEVEVLKRFCTRAPLTLKADHELLTDRRFSPHLYFAWKQWNSTQKQAEVPLPAHNQGLTRSTSHGRRFSATLALLNPIYAKVQGLTIVLNGVAFQRPNEVLGCPFACGVVYVDHLSKNASHTDLVEQEQFEQLLQELQELVEELWQELASSGVPVATGSEQSVIGYLKQRYRPAKLPKAISLYILRLESSIRFHDLDACERLLVEAEAVEGTENQQQGRNIRTEISQALSQGRLRDVVGAVDQELCRAAALRERALRDCGDEDAHHQARELLVVVEGLAESRPLSFPQQLSESDSLTDWDLMRRVLAAWAHQSWEAAEQFLGRLDPKSTIKAYLRAEQKGDAAKFLHVAQLQETSSYLWHEAASVFLQQGDYGQALEFRTRALELSPLGARYFIDWTARQAKGKCSFPDWLRWYIRSKWHKGLDPGVRSLELRLREGHIERKYLLKALADWPPGSEESYFLSHLIVWTLRSQKVPDPDFALQFRARTLLQGMLVNDGSQTVVQDRL